MASQLRDADVREELPERVANLCGQPAQREVSSLHIPYWCNKSATEVPQKTITFSKGLVGPQIQCYVP